MLKLMNERPIDFGHDRSVYCRACRRKSKVDDSWMSALTKSVICCPACSKQWEAPTDFCFDFNDDDQMKHAHNVTSAYWYHTSLHPDWLLAEFDPEIKLTEVERVHAERYASGGVAGWASRQKAQALHIGTYEAAIENMLRHMFERGAEQKQFYLYRVVLNDDCKILDEVHPEPPAAWGSTAVNDILGNSLEVYRYVNACEDKSSISLALTNRAVSKVQMIPIPILTLQGIARVDELVERLKEAERTPATPLAAPKMDFEDKLREIFGAPRKDSVGKLGTETSKNRFGEELRKVSKELAADLPESIKEKVNMPPITVRSGQEIRSLVEKLVGLHTLVAEPCKVLTELDKQPWKSVSGN